LSWKGFRDIFLSGDELGFDLVVDELVIALASFLFEKFKREVLFYVKMTKPPFFDGRRLVFYLGFKENIMDEVFIPRQESSFIHVKVVENDFPPDFLYAVVHTHPPGIRRFSRIDIETINVNHVVSLVVADGKPVDASISFGFNGYIVEARPRVLVAERRLVLSETEHGFGSLVLNGVSEGLIESILASALKEAREKIVGRVALA
jgi:proteasome lid subunit RPN8/RPN11